jgi:hypothetical protein
MLIVEYWGPHAMLLQARRARRETALTTRDEKIEIRLWIDVFV